MANEAKREDKAWLVLIEPEDLPKDDCPNEYVIDEVTVAGGEKVLTVGPKTLELPAPNVQNYNVICRINDGTLVLPTYILKQEDSPRIERFRKMQGAKIVEIKEADFIRFATRREGELPRQVVRQEMKDKNLDSDAQIRVERAFFREYNWLLPADEKTARPAASTGTFGARVPMRHARAATDEKRPQISASRPLFAIGLSVRTKPFALA